MTCYCATVFKYFVSKWCKMTTFAKCVIMLSALIVALGWLAGGGSVNVDAAQIVDRLSGFLV